MNAAAVLFLLAGLTRDACGLMPFYPRTVPDVGPHMKAFLEVAPGLEHMLMPAAPCVPGWTAPMPPVPQGYSPGYNPCPSEGDLVRELLEEDPYLLGFFDALLPFARQEAQAWLETSTPQSKWVNNYGGGCQEILMRLLDVESAINATKIERRPQGSRHWGVFWNSLLEQARNRGVKEVQRATEKEQKHKETEL
ncbi:hypothetical protein DUNSADRAFT_3507 [Dunaliella salina]|uniref:Uncharacterized protein n=1 Tax=Dunaliella salina TaxID=3046 RepID=A0ABQ7GTU5_DUNSA|nr:hypothetical protein DUNSADRAFT_3507 [Dunaliella salina]|eukprot:KAF5838020.1 hypothetical protein DUNSADRAFT_3507 [Dunaliella salina]